MFKRYSIAEARNHLAAIVHDLEQRPLIELTRRGKAVAVLLSIQEYQRLASSKINFWDAYVAFCNTVSLPELNLEPSLFKGLREPSPGREMNWRR